MRVETESGKYVSGALDDTIQGVPDNTPAVVPKGDFQYLYTRFFIRKISIRKWASKTSKTLIKC